VVVVQVRQAEMEVVLLEAELTLGTAETELSGPPVAGTTTAAAAAVQSTNTTQQRVVPAAWVVGEMVLSALRPEPMVQPTPAAVVAARRTTIPTAATAAPGL
jgi:hypothetical protein